MRPYKALCSLSFYLANCKGLALDESWLKENSKAAGLGYYKRKLLMRMNAVYELTVQTRRSHLNLISSTGQMEIDDETYCNIKVTNCHF